MLMDTNGHTILSEDYCSYEVAKLLKEKGFDEKCRTKYCTDGRFDVSLFHYKNSEINEDAYNAPTHQMTMKWLREVHNISVEPFSDWVFSDVGWICLWSVDIAKIVRDGLITELTRKSYEEAVEAALKYVLENLI